MKVELDLSNYATKADLKNATGVDISDFAKKTDLAHLKSDVDILDNDKLKNIPSRLSSLRSNVDKLDIGKLETTPADVSKLSNAVKIDAVKKTDHNELIKEFNNINTTDATDLVKRTIIPRLINHDDGTYITTQEFNKSASDNFKARLAQPNLGSKNDIANFVNKTDFDDKLKNLNKTKQNMKRKQNMYMLKMN